MQVFSTRRFEFLLFTWPRCLLACLTARGRFIFLDNAQRLLNFKRASRSLLRQVYKYWILAWFYRYFWKLIFSCFYFRQFRSQICVFWAYGPLGGPPWVLRGASFFIKIHRKYVCFEHMGPSGGPRKIEKLTLCFLGGPRGALGAPLGSLLGHFPFCLRAGGWREA